MTTLVEGPHPGGFLVWETARDYTRETVTIASGAGVLAPGTVLGRITASGKFAAHAPGAADGTQTAAALLWGAVDATIPDRDRDEWVRLEIESNPLPICTRPQVLRAARRT